jgi:hypothetical protein
MKCDEPQRETVFTFTALTEEDVIAMANFGKMGGVGTC